MAYNVVFGHTHRPSVTEGHSVGYNGVKAVNAPSLCRNKGVPYLTAGYAPDWGLGIAICEFYPHLRRSTIHNVRFHKEGDVLWTSWHGKRYEVDVLAEDEDEYNGNENTR